MAKTNQEEQRKAPILRFKGFTNDWEQGKLKNITQQIKRTNRKISPILTISAKNGWMKQKDRFSRVIAGKELKNYIELHKNELSYNHGNSKYAKYGIIYVQRDYDKALVPKVYHSFMVVDGDPRFIENLSLGHKIDKELSKLITSGARQDGLLNINKNSFYSINLFYPTKKEQELISNLMDKINSLIALYEKYIKRIDVLENAVFFRLNAISSIKKTDKISNIYNIKRGSVLSKKNIHKKKDSKNIYPVYSSQTLKNGLLGYYSEYLFENSITWTTDGANAGTVNFRSGKFYCTNVCGVLSNEEGYCNEFMAKIIESQTPKFVSYVGNPKLMNNVMGDIKITFPTLELQNYYSKLLFKINKLKKLQIEKLRNLKQIKKELLDTMFI